MVILLVYAVTAGAQPSLIANPGGIIIPGLIGSAAILIVGFATGWAAGRFFQPRSELRHTLVFSTGMREFGIATAVSITFFDPETAVLPAIYGITMMIIASQLARRLSRNHPHRGNPRPPSQPLQCRSVDFHEEPLGPRMR